MRKLRSLVDAWPPTRSVASVEEIAALTGFLLHMSLVVRPGQFCVRWLLSAVILFTVHNAGVVMNEFALRSAWARRRITLGPESHRDMGCWRWVASDGIWLEGGRLFAPAHHLVDRPPTRTWFSDASKSAAGGFCLNTCVWCRHDWTEDQRTRVRGSSFTVRMTYPSMSLNVGRNGGVGVDDGSIASGNVERG